MITKIDISVVFSSPAAVEGVRTKTVFGVKGSCYERQKRPFFIFHVGEDFLPQYIFIVETGPFFEKGSWSVFYTFHVKKE